MLWPLCLNRILRHYPETISNTPFTTVYSIEMAKLTQATLGDMLHLVMANAQNKTGYLDYNKYGEKDGVGFEVCDSEMFVDNFVLGCYVPSNLVDKKSKKYKEVGQTNKSIRRILEESELMGCTVKGTQLNKVAGTVDPDMVFKRRIGKEQPCGEYFLQEYKVACPDLEYSAVMAFLRGGSYTKEHFFLRDIDVTMDYMGSFKRKEVMAYLLEDDKFRLQGSEKPADCTILQNERDVGCNCLSWIETEKGMEIRSKLYNKMVQMLESHAVRSKIGNHWKGWADQWGTRLAKCRDSACHRGLTRAEVTFYCKSKIPADDFIEEKLLSIAGRLPKSLVYSTPYHCTWQAYCECFHHSLVVVDKIAEKECGIIVHSVNEVTGKVSGKIIDNWREREKWCLANLTLSQQLPIDIIKIEPPGKDTDEKAKYRVTMDSNIKESRNGEIFKTRLVNRGPFSHSCSAKQEWACQFLLEKAGLLPHDNCIPLLSHKAANKKSKSNMVLKFWEKLEPKGLPQKRGRQRRQIKTTNQNGDKTGTEVEDSHDSRLKAAVDEVEKRQKDKKRVNVIFRAYSRARHGKLSQLELGTYNVAALKPCKQKYGRKYVMLLEVGDGLLPCYSNWDIETEVNIQHSQERMLELLRQNILYLENSPVATLSITGRRRDKKGNLIACCRFRFSQPWNEFACIEEEEVIPQPAVSADERGMPTIAQEEMIPYKNMLKLIDLPKGSSHTVSAIGHSEYYGCRLVVRLSDGKLYQAGDDLTDKEDMLTRVCKITIQRYRTNKSTRQKYAVCEIEGNERHGGQQRGDEAMEARSTSKSKKAEKRKMESTDNAETEEVKKLKL